MKWTKAIQMGEVIQQQFEEVVNVELKHGLIIIPVILNGETYRFLFDSGAPFSISDKLQNRYQFKTISKGHIVDTDKNRAKVNYVQVDTILIQNIPFVNQTAFVLNFESNPFINCMELDGIIGSNLIRFCNWKIEYQDAEITLFKSAANDMPDKGISIPFFTDQQYNVLVNMKVGETVIKNLTIDYGSNGSLSLPKHIFKTLKQNGEIGDTFIEKGYAESGIIGKPIQVNQEITYIDTVIFGELLIDQVKVKSSGSGLIGSKILSRYNITIDWNNRNLVFYEVDSADNDHKTFGLRIGYADDKKLYVQSIIEDSPAAEAGVQPNMQVLKIDSIDFTSNFNFCDYVDYLTATPDQVSLELSGLNGDIKKVFLEKRILIKQE